MRTILRVAGIALLVGAAAAGFWLYQLAWGLPFNFDHLIDRQAVYFLNYLKSFPAFIYFLCIIKINLC